MFASSVPGESYLGTITAARLSGPPQAGFGPAIPGVQVCGSVIMMRWGVCVEALEGV